MIAIAAFALVVSATPADLAFLQGQWEGREGPMRYQERWTEEAGGLMLGVARNLKTDAKGERAVGFEFLRIEFRRDGVYYVAQPGGKPKTEFRLTEISGRSARFENPAHDHPKVIRYSLEPDGSLKAVLEGNGKSQVFRFQPAPPPAAPGSR